jgi:hypothetical protein
MSSFSGKKPSLISVDRTSPYLRTQIPVTETTFQIKVRTMDNAQKIEHWINNVFRAYSL